MAEVVKRSAVVLESWESWMSLESGLEGEKNPGLDRPSKVDVTL